MLERARGAAAKRDERRSLHELDAITVVWCLHLPGINTKLAHSARIAGT